MLGLSAVFSAEVFLGAGRWVWVPYAIVLPVTGLGLWLLGRMTVTITDGELRAGGGRLPVHRVAGVTVLGPAEKRLLLGPAADRRAMIVQRPWLPGAVQVHVTGTQLDGSAGAPPYWMVSSRRPAALAAAILAARSTSGRGVDDGVPPEIAPDR